MVFLENREKQGNSSKQEIKHAGDSAVESAELKETLQRLQAEFENYSKRIEREKHDFKKFAVGNFIMELLPVLDSFDSAIEKIGGKERIGVEKVRNALLDVLEKHGVKKMDFAGKQFDPASMECIAGEKHPEKEEGIVLLEIQKGYSLHGKTLRTAKVKINSMA